MQKLWQGVYTAIITPFTLDGAVDYKTFGQLIDRQIDAGVAGIVVLGTTGETPTITPEEHKQITKWSAEHIGGRCHCITGASSNSTAEAIEYSKYAESCGVDGVLQSSPYYNKPTPKGMYEHFAAIAAAIDIPIMLYEVPGRTSVSITVDTLEKLFAISNINGIKIANDTSYMQQVINIAPEDFSILSGEDDLTIDLLKMGGDGMVSVTSNIIPVELAQMVQLGLARNTQDATELHDQYASLMSTCFIETNPQPVKTALSMMGLCEEKFRLPMTTMLPENKAKLSKVMQKHQLI